MKLFRVTSVDEGGVEINAAHACGMPGVRCDVCGNTWASTGIAYPTLAEACDVLGQRWPVRMDVYESLAQRVTSLREGLTLRPGADFGRLQGKARGKPDGVVWPNPWTVLFTETALERFGAHTEVTLPRVAAVALSTRGFDETLYELEIEAHGRALNATEPGTPPPCPTCGYERVRVPDRLVIDGSGLEPTRDVFRLGNLTTVILTSERFVRRARELGLPFQFEAVDVRPSAQGL